MKRIVFTGLVFVLGMAAGSGLFLFLSNPVPGVADPDVPAASAELEALKQREGKLREQLREQDLEIARLRAERANARPQAAPETSEEPPAESEAAPRRGYIRRMEERMARRVDEMAIAYGLDLSQRERLAEVFRKQMEIFRAQRRGEEVEPFSLDEAVAGILTEEQFEQYLAESQEEIYNRAELMATTQVIRLNQVAALSPEQQEQVYDTVHHAAQEMMISRQTGESYDMRSVIEQRLGSILTPEQMEAWRQDEGPVRGPGFGP